MPVILVLEVYWCRTMRKELITQWVFTQKKVKQTPKTVLYCAKWNTGLDFGFTTLCGVCNFRPVPCRSIYWTQSSHLSIQNEEQELELNSIWINRFVYTLFLQEYNLHVVTCDIKAHQVRLNRVPEEAIEDSVRYQMLLLTINKLQYLHNVTRS